MTIVDRTYDLPDLISGRDNLSYLIISVGVAPDDYRGSNLRPSRSNIGTR